MFTSSPVSALSAVLLLAASVRGDSACDLTTVYKGASQFLTSLSVHAANLFDGKDSLAGMTVFVPTDKFLDDSGITMFSLGAFQGENALPIMRRHVFASDPFADAALSDGAAMRNYNGALFVTQSRAFASPTNLRIGPAGRPSEEGALVRRAGLSACGGLTVHIIDRLLPAPSAEYNGVLYTDMERLLPEEPPKCTALLAALRTIKGAATFLKSEWIQDFELMVQPDPGQEAMFTVFVPNNAAFKAYETFDPEAYSNLVSDSRVWHQVASLHVAKTTWEQGEDMQLKTLAWCNTAPCVLGASVDDAGQGFVRPVRGEAPEAKVSPHGVPFCHGMIYPVDQVLRIDDEVEIDETAAAPGAGIVATAGGDLGQVVAEDEDGGSGLAPRAVLAPKGNPGDELDGVEERGVNDSPPQDYLGDEGASDDSEFEYGEKPAQDSPPQDYLGDEGASDDSEFEYGEKPAQDSPPQDYLGDEGASDDSEFEYGEKPAQDSPPQDYLGDEGATDDSEFDYRDGAATAAGDAANGGDGSPDPFIDAGSVIPGKEEWEQERDREAAAAA